MGRAISFISAMMIVTCGVYLLALQMASTRWHAVLLLTAISMLGFGLSWLWVDFISPSREQISEADSR